MTEKTNIKKPIAVVTTGGSGGHVFPAEAISKALVKKGFEVVFVTDKRGKAFADLDNVKTVRLMGESVMGRSILGKIRGAFMLYCGAIQALFLLRKLKPAVVVGVGGYASLPAVVAAHLWHMPVVLHEQNGVLGRVNRILGPNARLILTSFEKTGMMPEEVRTIHVGLPVREGVVAKKRSPYPLMNDGFQLLIFGGSQGASFFSKKLPEALIMLPAGVRGKISITAQVRAEDMEATELFYKNKGFKSVVLKSFFDNMPELIEKAHLIIGRAGASTVTEAAMIGRPAILIPLPTSADNHQVENARQFCDKGAGWLIREEDFEVEQFAARLGGLIDEPDLLYHAASCAYDFASPDAAEKSADLIMDIAKGNNA